MLQSIVKKYSQALGLINKSAHLWDDLNDNSLPKYTSEGLLLLWEWQTLSETTPDWGSSLRGIESFNRSINSSLDKPAAPFLSSSLAMKAPLRMTNLSSINLLFAVFRIFPSTLFAEAKRKTSTGLSWPIRCALSMAYKICESLGAFFADHQLS